MVPVQVDYNTPGAVLLAEVGAGGGSYREIRGNQSLVMTLVTETVVGRGITSHRKNKAGAIVETIRSRIEAGFENVRDGIIDVVDMPFAGVVTGRAAKVLADAMAADVETETGVVSIHVACADAAAVSLRVGRGFVMAGDTPHLFARLQLSTVVDASVPVVLGADNRVINPVV